jgi:hypothetical protein
MDLAQLVKDFGLPVALLLYFIWQNASISKEYNSYVKDIAQKAVDAINKSTEVDTKMLQVAERMEKRLDGDAGRGN